MYFPLRDLHPELPGRGTGWGHWYCLCLGVLSVWWVWLAACIHTGYKCVFTCTYRERMLSLAAGWTQAQWQPCLYGDTGFSTSLPQFLSRIWDCERLLQKLRSVLSSAWDGHWDRMWIYVRYLGSQACLLYRALIWVSGLNWMTLLVTAFAQAFKWPVPVLEVIRWNSACCLLSLSTPACFAEY